MTLEERLEKLNKKVENGVTLYFYPGLGWVTKERLQQSDVKVMEEYREFMCNPANSHNCDKCPENEHYSGGKLPCGQYRCWVDRHCEEVQPMQDFL